MRFPRLVILGAAAVVTATLGACGNDDPPAAAPASSAPAASSPVPVEPSIPPSPPRPTTAAPTRTTTTNPPRPGASSDLSQLRSLGIDLEVGVLIDVADDGVDRFLQIGRNGVVDFTGTTSTDSTMMALHPAPVTARNRVLIRPPFWNEDPGAGSCVADTAGAPLALEPCRAGRASQIWQVVPAGDSGQFELRGAHGILHVEDGKLTTANRGRTGLQTLDFKG